MSIFESFRRVDMYAFGASSFKFIIYFLKLFYVYFFIMFSKVLFCGKCADVPCHQDSSRNTGLPFLIWCRQIQVLKTCVKLFA